MKTTKDNPAARSFRLPTFSWPLAACMSTALIVSIAPGCEDKGIEEPEGARQARQSTSSPPPLLEERSKATPTESPKQESIAMELPGVDELGEEFIDIDPLRLPHAETDVDHLAQGQAFLDDGELSEAIDAFRKAAFDSDSYEAFFGLARAARLSKDHDLALEGLAAAADADVTSAQPLVMAARLTLSGGDIDLGLVFIDRAIGREPDRPDAHNVRGRLWMAKEQYHKAVLSFERAVDLDPQFVWAWNNKGYVDLLRGRYEEAVDSLEKAVELSPSTAYMHNNLGLAYERSGLTSEALSAFQEALNLRPEYVNATINLDRVAQRDTRLAEAETEAESEGPKVLEDDSLEYVPGG